MESTHSRPVEEPATRVAGDVRGIDGVVPDSLLTPRTPGELAELLGTAAAERKAVAPFGGGTALGLGNPPRRIDWLVSTKSMNRVLDYAPDDLTISVEAGITLQEVTDVLAEQGQTLPVESPDPEKATIGGVFATGIYGARRTGSGTLRDYVIGISAAYPNGTVAKAGGMVVKNVSGFDLMRMHNGALGTLGIITALNFKVLPAPRDESTIIFELEELEELGRLVGSGLTLVNGLTSLELAQEADAWKVLVRISGRPATVRKSGQILEKLAGGSCEVLPKAASVNFWAEYDSRSDASGIVGSTWLRIREQPKFVEQAVASAIENCSTFTPAQTFVSCSPVLGTVDIRIDAGAAEPSQICQFLRTLRSKHPLTYLISGPAAAKEGIDTFAEKSESIELMKRLKQEFDPDSVLNPGRFAGHI